MKSRSPILKSQAEKTLKLDIIIEPDEDVYHAYCPMLKGCHSSGSTIKEAFKNIQEAAKIHLEVMIEDREEIPEIGVVNSIDQLNLVFKLKERDQVAIR